MASTEFVPGTTITSVWLNQINDAIFGSSGYYSTALDGAANIMWFLDDTQKAQVRANLTTTDLTAAIATARDIIGNKRPMYYPAGTYSVSSLSFIGDTGGIIGDGIDNTVFYANSAVSKFIDMTEVADLNPMAGVFKGFTLYGNGLVTTGIYAKYRHLTSFEDIRIYGCTNGLVESDTYVCRHKNMRLQGNGIGAWLVGSNHSSTYIGCTFDQNSGTQLKVQSLGAGADGNEALYFANCDFEFGAGGSATGIDWDGSSGTFDTCYIGENIPGASIVCRNGQMNIQGGALFFGSTVNGYLFNPVGGRVTVRDAQINGQTYGNVSMLSGVSSTGKWKLLNSQFNGLVSGTPCFLGDVVDYDVQTTVYASRLGKSWTGQGNNLTFSTTLTGNKKTFTALTAPGPTPLLGARSNTFGLDGWRDGERLYMMLVYESSKPVTVRLSAGTFGGSPTKVLHASYPATSGTPFTAVGFEVDADSAAYTFLEVIQDTSTTGDTLTIHECIFSDSRTLNKGSGAFGNLAKF